MTFITRHARPAFGRVGAISAGHPFATAAGTEILARGGNAADAAIAAQAVICVVMPQAAGLGGDMLALIFEDGHVHAVNGAGLSPAVVPARYSTDGGSSVTVPGLVDAWLTMHRELGRLPLESILEPAIRLAERGFRVDRELARAAAQQAPRLIAHGAREWSLLAVAEGDIWRQPELATTLRRIGTEGRSGFYSGEVADRIAAAAQSHRGTLSAQDLHEHRTEVTIPLTTSWGGAVLAVQPPASQGVLLALAARFLDRLPAIDHDLMQHVVVEATEAAFTHRDRAADGMELFDLPMDIDMDRAGHRGGPRAYLHTAGVAVADADGIVVSSLISVFDDFGSAVLVPELGIVLNNRAGGFTSGANAPGPAKHPIHTLAPAMVLPPGGDVLALATPGADGQVQTVLQVLARMRFEGEPLESALSALRWRSQDGELLIEEGHPDRAGLTERGHRTREMAAGDDLFGAVVAAGFSRGVPFAASDWRRLVTTGVT
jgi:gamma-glutamyltranspeptidase/glutathione hydrolase